jgi:hypothetical protein
MQLWSNADGRELLFRQNVRHSAGTCVRNSGNTGAQQGAWKDTTRHVRLADEPTAFHYVMQ